MSDRLSCVIMWLMKKEACSPENPRVINYIPSITAPSNSINVAQIMICAALPAESALAAETAKTLRSLALGRDCDPYNGNYWTVRCVTGRLFTLIFFSSSEDRPIHSDQKHALTCSVILMLLQNLCLVQTFFFLSFVFFSFLLPPTWITLSLFKSYISVHLSLGRPMTLHPLAGISLFVSEFFRPAFLLCVISSSLYSSLLIALLTLRLIPFFVLPLEF